MSEINIFNLKPILIHFLKRGILDGKEKLNVYKLSPQSKSNFKKKVGNPDLETSVTLILHFNHGHLKRVCYNLADNCGFGCTLFSFLHNKPH